MSKLRRLSFIIDLFMWWALLILNLVSSNSGKTFLDYFLEIFFLTILLLLSGMPMLINS